MVNAEGVTIDDDKVQAVKDLPVPTDVIGVRSFYGDAELLQAIHS